MHFSRKTVISVSIFLFVLFVTLPIITVLYFSWQQAKELEYEQLYTNAKRVIQRSRTCFDEIDQTFDNLDAVNAKVCTIEYKQEMRDMTFNKRCIQEIQYIDEGAVRCGTGRKNNTNAKFISDGFIMPDGSSVSLDISNFSNQGLNLIRFQRDDFAVLVDSRSFTDIITDPYIKIALTTADGQVISTLNYLGSNLEFIDHVLKSSSKQEVDESLVAVYRLPGLYYIVSESIEYALKEWYKSLYLFIPFGLIMSLIACSAVVWGLRHRLSDLGELKIAVARREFVIFYQPIIDFKTGACIGAESLVRWKKPDGTIVSPDLFIPLAETSGLIVDITDQAIDSIIANLASTLCKNRDLHISLNVSGLDFNSQRIFTKLETAISGTGIMPQQIWLEITERSFLDYSSASKSINDARNLGYKIVIDDFGTGYSSLSHLKELKIDLLKIDKSFVNAVDTDSVTSNVIEHIINLAKELKLQIVAEGVETEAQAEYLKQHQVEYAQGWLYAKAMPLEQFLAYYHTHELK